MDDKEALSSIEAESIVDSDLRSLLDKTIIQKILASCRQEWEIVKDRIGEYKIEILPIKSKKCNICNTKIRYVYSIRNIFTKIELIVGSECIKNYEIGADKAAEFKRNYAKQLQERQLIYYSTRLKKQYPRLADQLRNYQYYLNYKEFALTTELENSFNYTLGMLEDSNRNYLETGNESTLIRIGELLAEMTKLTGIHDKYFERQSSNPWALTTRMKKSAQQSEPDKLEKLLETCCITEETLFCITEEDYCKQIIERLSNLVISRGFWIIPKKSHYSKVVVEVEMKHSRVLITLNYYEFVKVYGVILFNPKAITISMQEYLQKNGFSVHENSQQIVLSLVSNAFPTGVGFLKSRDGISFEIIESQVFLIFYSSSGLANDKFMRLHCPTIINNLFSAYIKKDFDHINAWLFTLSTKKTLSPLTDIYDTVSSYSYHTSESRFR